MVTGDVKVIYTLKDFLMPHSELFFVTVSNNSHESTILIIHNWTIIYWLRENRAIKQLINGLEINVLLPDFASKH